MTPGSLLAANFCHNSAKRARARGHHAHIAHRDRVRVQSVVGDAEFEMRGGAQAQQCRGKESVRLRDQACAVRWVALQESGSISRAPECNPSSQRQVVVPFGTYGPVEIRAYAQREQQVQVLVRDRKREPSHLFVCVLCRHPPVRYRYWLLVDTQSPSMYMCPWHA